MVSTYGAGPFVAGHTYFAFSRIGCRVVRAKADLIRLVRDEGGVVRVDRDGYAVGRGAYVCATTECVEKALQAGGLLPELDPALTLPADLAKLFDVRP